jgi:hypothetical protein
VPDEMPKVLMDYMLGAGGYGGSMDVPDLSL